MFLPAKNSKCIKLAGLNPLVEWFWPTDGMFDTPGLYNLRHKNFKRQCPKKTMDLN